MDKPADADLVNSPNRLQVWLARPLSNLQCALGWCAASSVFAGFVIALGGPSPGDSTQSLFSTWAFAHGDVNCAFPPHSLSIAPVYPLISGGVAALTRIGHAVPYPHGTALGAHCNTAVLAAARWSLDSGAVLETLRIGYLSWLFLMAGLIAWIRASGRGRCWWEPTTLLVAAVLPTVWMCIESTFHPQDLIAMGLALAAAACAQRQRWIAGGILIALAILTQQFALLVGVPLFVIASREQRTKFALSAICTGAVIALPILIAAGKDAAHGTLVGSGIYLTTGGTVLAELLHGTPLTLLTRGLPVLCSLLFTWWATQRLGQRCFEALPLACIIGVSLLFRLAFEMNLYGYYFMAASVMLLLVDVALGRIRDASVAWLAAVTLAASSGPLSLAFLHQSWGNVANHVLVVGIVLLASTMLIVRLFRHRQPWTILMWFTLIVLSVLDWGATSAPLRHPPSVLLWQLMLTLSALALMVHPLVNLLRGPSESRTQQRQSPRKWVSISSEGLSD